MFITEEIAIKLREAGYQKISMEAESINNGSKQNWGDYINDIEDCKSWLLGNNKKDLYKEIFSNKGL
jgi:hypothetical protein